jgi:hypothetical protein
MSKGARIWLNRYKDALDKTVDDANNYLDKTQDVSLEEVVYLIRRTIDRFTVLFALADVLGLNIVDEKPLTSIVSALKERYRSTIELQRSSNEHKQKT